MNKTYEKNYNIASAIYTGLGFIAAAVLIWAITGCTTLTTAQRTALTSIESAAATIAADYAATGKVNYAQAIPVLVSSAATFASTPKVNTAQVATAVQEAVADGTGSKPTAQKIAAVLTDVLPAVVSGSTANQAVAAAATGASAGANK